MSHISFFLNAFFPSRFSVSLFPTASIYLRLDCDLKLTRKQRKTRDSIGFHPLIRHHRPQQFRLGATTTITTMTTTDLRPMTSFSQNTNLSLLIPSSRSRILIFPLASIQGTKSFEIVFIHSSSDYRLTSFFSIKETN